MTVRIITADVIDGLRQLPDESVHTCITSPPYWGLRDYGVEGQIGLEATPAAFVARMVEVFTEVRRVLRADGTCWVNLGDSYATGAGKVGGAPGGGEQGARWAGYRGAHSKVNSGKAAYRLPDADGIGPMTQPNRLPIAGLKPKDLIGIPWRVAFALQADGWWLRSDIIWAKPNPMPESVTDRPTKAHEYVFLLTKSERYFYDAEAIKEPASVNSHGGLQPNAGAKQNAIGQQQGKTTLGMRPVGRAQPGVYSTRPQSEPRGPASNFGEFASRNKRSVWTVPTSPYPEAHFATFPPDLIEPMILAGCPLGGTVLDPFSGAGTTALVADRLQRNAIGIELNPKYAAMSEARITRDAPLFANVETAA